MVLGWGVLGCGWFDLVVADGLLCCRLWLVVIVVFVGSLIGCLVCLFCWVWILVCWFACRFVMGYLPCGGFVFWLPFRVFVLMFWSYGCV